MPYNQTQFSIHLETKPLAIVLSHFSRAVRVPELRADGRAGGECEGAVHVDAWVQLGDVPALRALCLGFRIQGREAHHVRDGGRGPAAAVPHRVVPRCARVHRR